MADFLLAGVDDKVLITICIGAIIFFIVGYLTLSRYQSSGNQGASQMRTADHHSYDNDVCPICLGTHRLAVETNCGHKFCGSCLRSYLNRTHGDFTLFSGRQSCPLCRQDINILLLNFSPEDTTSVELEEEKSNVERTVHEYNVRFGGGPRNLWSYVQDCPVLIRHMFSDFFTFGGLVWMFRLRVLICCLCALAYVFNPLDIIPEAVFGIFGFLDDVVIFLLCVIYISIIYRRVVMNRSSTNVG